MNSVQYFFIWSLAYIFKLLKRRVILMLCVVGAIIVVLMLRWGLVCTNLHTRLHIQLICDEHSRGESIGNLCHDLCQSDGLSSVSCHKFYLEKEAVFSAVWRNTSVVFKSLKKESIQKLHRFDSKNNIIYPSEEEFSKMLKANVKAKFNMTLNDIDVRKMSYVQTSHIYTLNRYIEMENIWALIQNNEYLAMSLYEKFDIFPKIVGSCGLLYAVERLNSISGFQHLVDMYDSHKEWVRRIKIAILIMDYLKKLDLNLPESLLICDVKMNHFGLTDDMKKIVYLDLDSVHPVSVADKMTGDGSKCETHSDCDNKDCRSFCNLVTSKCQYGVANNNLQIVCERIFLGWVMSGRVMVPGLLIGPWTPRALVELLEQCANPAGEPFAPRAPATKEIRKRLYDVLVDLSLS